MLIFKQSKRTEKRSGNRKFGKWKIVKDVKCPHIAEIIIIYILPHFLLLHFACEKKSDHITYVILHVTFFLVIILA